jgi:adenylate cyclase
MSHEALISPIREWLIDEALGDSDITELFDTLCMRISSVGIPITRARLFWPTLHPLFQAETVSWDKGSKAVLDQFVHQDEASDDWNKSPLKYLIDHDLDIIRRELTGHNKLLDFELLEGLEQKGFTDFIAMSTDLEGTSFRTREGGNDSGIMVTWTTNAPNGFSDDDLLALQKIQRRFAVACKVMIQARISSNIAHTYLGSRAGGSVLDGQIRRGDGQTTNAVIWYSDLRDSTRLAETMPPVDYFNLLNAYFSATAQPIIDNGGEILDFIGDAVLGIFPYENKRELNAAAKAAHKALHATCGLSTSINEERKKHGLQEFNFGVGVNVGEVMFGNIGIPSRLSFSVIGSAVNEAARIEALTKKFKRTILVGKSFADLSPKEWKSLGEHKLQGVSNPIEIFDFSKQ